MYRKCACCGGKVRLKKNHAYAHIGKRKVYGCKTCDESGRFSKWLDAQSKNKP